MVGAPDIDDAVEFAIVEFIVVIRYIRGEVGVLSIASDYDVVLILAERRGSEPLGPVSLFPVSGVLNDLNRLGVGSLIE